MRKRYRRVRLGDLIERIEAGVSVRSFDQPAGPGEKGVLKTSALSKGRFEPYANKRIRPDELARAAVSPSSGCTLVSRMNTMNLVGESAFIDKDYPHLFLPDRIWQLHPNRAIVDPYWFGLKVGTPYVRECLRAVASGTSGSMKNISQEAFKRVEVLLPELEQQARFAAVIKGLDGRLRVLDQLLMSKRALKLGLMRGLITGELRFPDFRMAAWTESYIAELFKERNETGHPDLRLLSVTADRGIIPREEVERKDTSNADKSKYQRVLVGDIAYNTMRMWQGVSALSAYEGIVSPAYTVLVPTGLMLARYARHLFKLPRMIHTFWRHSQGLVDDTLSLKYPSLARIAVRYPSDLAEQRRIAEVLDDLDQVIALRERQRAAYESQKHGIMQRLLSAELMTAPTASDEAELAHA